MNLHLHKHSSHGDSYLSEKERRKKRNKSGSLAPCRLTISYENLKHVQGFWLALSLIEGFGNRIMVTSLNNEVTLPMPYLEFSAYFWGLPIICGTNLQKQFSSRSVWCFPAPLHAAIEKGCMDVTNNYINHVSLFVEMHRAVCIACCKMLLFVWRFMYHWASQFEERRRRKLVWLLCNLVCTFMP